MVRSVVTLEEEFGGLGVKKRNTEGSDIPSVYSLSVSSQINLA